MEKTKIVELEITGTETTTQYRTVYVEVPIEMSDEEIGCINADIFNGVQERTEWEIDDSDGVDAEGFPDVIGQAEDDIEPDVIVHIDESGEYRARVNEKFL
ncbi:hypothetical protein N9D23_00575 [Rubripirellula sp.]|nr:hypothetical protein [Rubripirellula sp.]